MIVAATAFGDHSGWAVLLSLVHHFGYGVWAGAWCRCAAFGTATNGKSKFECKLCVCIFFHARAGQGICPAFSICKMPYFLFKNVSKSYN